MKSFLKVLKYIGISILVILLVLFVILWINSPGEAQPIVDKNGNTLSNSISNIEYATIGGIEQYFIIRGQDQSKPILLFLHGGPGSPEFPLMKDPDLNLEKEFVVIHWEQRGAGMTFDADMDPASMNIDQLVSDAGEVASFLKDRFKRDKIYLMGHSWGSILGMLTAEKYPEHFHAFISIGQVCKQFRGELISFNWVKQQAEERQDEEAIKELSEMKFPDSLDASDVWLDFLMKERAYVYKYGGGLEHKPVDMNAQILEFVLNTKEYTVSDKIKYFQGMLFSLEHLWNEVIETNLFEEVDSIAIPVHIIQGKRDYQTPYVLAESFFYQLKAKEKHFHSFKSSAHSPFLDEVEKFNEVVEEVILK